MHFESITFNESFDYTLKNIVDLLTIPNTDAGWREKYNRVKTEFDKHYAITPKVEDWLLTAITKFCKSHKTYEALDLDKMNRFYHLKLYFDQAMKTKTLGEFYMRFAGWFYKSDTAANHPGDYMSKYIYPYLLDNRYVIFILFDEKRVHKVSFIATENTLDIEANATIMNLVFDLNELTKKFLRK